MARRVAAQAGAASGVAAADRRFRREPSATVPAELLTPTGDLALFPQRHGTDGAYAARLRRIG